LLKATCRRSTSSVASSRLTGASGRAGLKTPDGGTDQLISTDDGRFSAEKRPLVPRDDGPKEGRPRARSKGWRTPRSSFLGACWHEGLRGPPMMNDAPRSPERNSKQPSSFASANRRPYSLLRKGGGLGWGFFTESEPSVFRRGDSPCSPAARIGPGAGSEGGSSQRAFCGRLPSGKRFLHCGRNDGGDQGRPGETSSVTTLGGLRTRSGRLLVRVRCRTCGARRCS